MIEHLLDETYYKCYSSLNLQKATQSEKYRRLNATRDARHHTHRSIIVRTDLLHRETPSVSRRTVHIFATLAIFKITTKAAYCCWLYGYIVLLQIFNAHASKYNNLFN